MDLPQELKIAAETLIEGYKPQQLKRTAQELSERYRNESGSGKKLLTEDLEASVYSLVRMPATYGAVASAINYAMEYYSGEPPRTLLDVGAGTGAASWAICNNLNLEHITCLERETAMRKVGARLMQEGDSVLQNADWISADLTAFAPEGTKSENNSKNETLPNADLVVASYVLNEMGETERRKVLLNLWKAANKLLLIVEPGSMKGAQVIADIRKQLLAEGAHIVAPCPHEGECRLAVNDWCHFSCRVQRSKLHKELKEGDVPYEDEKFSFIAFVRDKADCPNVTKARIIRHPYIEKGLVKLELCSVNQNSEVTIRKRDGEAFKYARKAKHGDSFDFLT